MKVVSDKVSKARSKVQLVTPTIFAGGTSVLSVSLYNRTNNPITGLSQSAFSLSAATGSVAISLLAVTPAQPPGTYEVYFSATDLGSISKLSIKIHGVKLTYKPTIEVVTA